MYGLLFSWRCCEETKDEDFTTASQTSINKGSGDPGMWFMIVSTHVCVLCEIQYEMVFNKLSGRNWPLQPYVAFRVHKIGQLSTVQAHICTN